MTNPLNSKQFRAHSRFAAGAIAGFCFLFFAALLLAGCTTPPPRAPVSQMEAPPEAKASRPPERVSAESAPTAPVLDEKEPAAVSDDKVIYFPLRITAVDDIGKQKLRLHAEYLKQNPKTILTLVGYTDNQGSRSYNLAITEQRILTVRAWLRRFGVSTGQIRRNSEKTLVACTSADCRQRMRRVELVY